MEFATAIRLDHRIGERADCAVSGVRHERRMDQHRRCESGELGTDRRGARRSGVARGPEIRHEFREDGERRLVDGRHERGARGGRRPSGWSRSMLPLFPQDPSTRLDPQTRARIMVVSIRRQARRACSVARSTLQPRPRESRGLPPMIRGSTRGRCSVNRDADSKTIGCSRTRYLFKWPPQTNGHIDLTALSVLPEVNVQRIRSGCLSSKNAGTYAGIFAELRVF